MQQSSQSASLLHWFEVNAATLEPAPPAAQLISRVPKLLTSSVCLLCLLAFSVISVRQGCLRGAVGVTQGCEFSWGGASCSSVKSNPACLFFLSRSHCGFLAACACVSLWGDFSFLQIFYLATEYISDGDKRLNPTEHPVDSYCSTTLFIRLYAAGIWVASAVINTPTH